MDVDKLTPELQGLADYHTHLCIGVLIGYKACKYAVELIGESEDMFVIANKKSCGDDAIRFLLKCTEEERNFLHRDGDQLAWSFYNRDEEEGVTLILNPGVKIYLPSDKEQVFEILLNLPVRLVFNIEPFVPDEI